MTEDELISICASEHVAIRRRVRHQRVYVYLQRSRAGRRHERYLCPLADLASQSVDAVRACIARLPGSIQPATSPDDPVRQLLREASRPSPAARPPVPATGPDDLVRQLLQRRAARWRGSIASACSTRRASSMRHASSGWRGCSSMLHSRS